MSLLNTLMSTQWVSQAGYAISQRIKKIKSKSIKLLAKTITDFLFYSLTDHYKQSNCSVRNVNGFDKSNMKASFFIHFKDSAGKTTSCKYIQFKLNCSLPVIPSLLFQMCFSTRRKSGVQYWQVPSYPTKTMQTCLITFTSQFHLLWISLNVLFEELLFRRLSSS